MINSEKSLLVLDDTIPISIISMNLLNIPYNHFILLLTFPLQYRLISTFHYIFSFYIPPTNPSLPLLSPLSLHSIQYSSKIISKPVFNLTDNTTLSLTLFQNFFFSSNFSANFPLLFFFRLLHYPLNQSFFPVCSPRLFSLPCNYPSTLLDLI